MQETSVRLITSDDPALAEALHMTVGSGDGSGAVHDERTAASEFLASARRRQLKPDLLVGVFEEQRLRFAILLVESPGRAALLMAPWDAFSQEILPNVSDAIRRVLRFAADRRIVLVETLVALPDEAVTQCLQQTGFRRLTQLIYLRRRVASGTKVRPRLTNIGNLDWVSYAPQRESLFLEALEASYRDSLDCPELTGLRPVGDVLAGHRSAGDFDPALWFVVRCNGVAAGVLLLSRLPQTRALEIVYLGVAQPFRGTGVSDAMLERAAELALADGATSLTLAVDSRNHPARRMYERRRFTEFARRDAWIAILERSEGCAG